MDSLEALRDEVTACTRCARLVAHREDVARTKRRMYMDWEYWGKPVPGFGDPQAKLLIVGLAPAAHGANRTGRMFTGDRSGNWLYRALHRFGFANQPTSEHRDDGLELTGAYVTAVVRCAPPDNRPTAEEKEACLPFLHREFALLTHVRAIVALGHIAYAGVWQLAKAHGAAGPRPTFGHCMVHRLAPDFPAVICSYHPSQQNTQTGRLTEPMFDAVFRTARELIDTDSNEAE